MRPAVGIGLWGAALAVLGGAAGAEIASVETPSGLARVEGDPLVGGQRLLVGDAVVVEDPAYATLWIEAKAGDLLLVGLSDGGTLCAAEFLWLRTTDLATTEPFGTCSDLATVTHDSETVTVTMATQDAEHPSASFVWDGRGPVREVLGGQEPSGSPPEAGAEAWIGRYAFDLLRSSDWRGPLVALMGEEGYALAQDAIVSSTPMAREGKWVAGTGFDRFGGGQGAIALSVDDGRLLVAVQAGPDAEPRLWGEPRGPLPPAVASIMAPPE